MGVILLTGMPGAGKTSVGRELAHILNRPFVDLDEAIEQNIGTSIHEIFAERGEAFFRDCESELLLRFLHLGNAVISLGAGAMERDGNLEAIRGNTVLVYLRASIETLAERIRDSYRLRPLLKAASDDGELRKLLRDLLRRREPRYRLADITVEVDTMESPKAAAEHIVGQINTR